MNIIWLSNLAALKIRLLFLMWSVFIHPELSVSARALGHQLFKRSGQSFSFHVQLIKYLFMSVIPEFLINKVTPDFDKSTHCLCLYGEKISVCIQQNNLKNFGMCLDDESWEVALPILHRVVVFKIEIWTFLSHRFLISTSVITLDFFWNYLISAYKLHFQNRGMYYLFHD